MNILSWNCQGLGHPGTINSLRTWCWRDRTNIVFVMEMMLQSNDLVKVHKKCGFSNGMCLSSHGNSGVLDCGGGISTCKSRLSRIPI